MNTNTEICDYIIDIYSLVYPNIANYKDESYNSEIDQKMEDCMNFDFEPLMSKILYPDDDEDNF